MLTGHSLQIAASRCVHRKAAMARCRQCVDVCPAGAWAIDASGLSFDDERCTGCGLCVPVCPTSALALERTPFQTVQPEATAPARVLLACAGDDRSGSAAAHLVCIDALDEVALLRWASAGVRLIDACSAGCRRCAPDGGARLAQRVAAVNRALGARRRPTITLRIDQARGAPSGPIVVPTNAGSGSAAPARSAGPRGAAAADPAERSVRISRRAFLGIGARRTTATADPGASVAMAADAVSPASEGLCPGSAQDGVATRLIAASLLAALGEGPPLWAAVIDARRCDACGACASLCPTGAIVLEQDAESALGGALVLDMNHCIGCRLCVDVCDPRALAMAMPGTGPQQRQRLSLRVEPCSDCGRSFRAGLMGAHGQLGSSQRCIACRSVPFRRLDRIVQQPSSDERDSG